MITIGAPTRLHDGRADSELRWATIKGKKIFILRQRGSFPNISYDHGRLLAPQIEDGVFPEIIDTIRTGTDMNSDTMDWIIGAVYRRLSDDVFDACSDEFRAAVKAAGDGIFDALVNPRFTPEDVRDAMVAIDVGNLADGLGRRMTKPLASEVSGTFGYVLGAVRRFRRGSVSNRTMGALDSKQTLGDGLQRIAAPQRRVGFGCTAMGAAPALTEDGLSLHARNFDGAFFDWNRHPGIFIVDEREANPDWHRYVAIGTAGLIYSGGISGVNDAGIAASIHQMSTAAYDTGRPGRGYEIAPYLQQRILREAGSLDEAEAILKSARHFASWTIVVTDAKVGRSVRFEICGGRQQVARMDMGDHFVQSNHFFAPGMAETMDFFGDAHFTPTFGKWLETRARVETVEKAYATGRSAGTIGTDWAIGLLASHGDSMLNGAPRSFGRTICKAYGLMASIARSDPDRIDPKDEIWMSIGDALPGPHATFAGFAIDWNTLGLSPVATRQVRAPTTVSTAFGRALSLYVQAFATVARPRDGAGKFLGRDPKPAEARALKRRARDLLGQAIEDAEDAGEIDPALRYARARLNLSLRAHAQAEEDLSFLRDAGRFGIPMHPYETALVLVLSATAAFAGGRNAQATMYLDEAEKAFKEVRRRFFPGTTKVHPDLKRWMDFIPEMRARGAPVELPEFEFVTVE